MLTLSFPPSSPPQLSPYSRRILSLRPSGYWRLGHNEDGWQASKRDWNTQVEAEQETRA